MIEIFNFIEMSLIKCKKKSELVKEIKKSNVSAATKCK